MSQWCIGLALLLSVGWMTEASAQTIVPAPSPVAPPPVAGAPESPAPADQPLPPAPLAPPSAVVETPPPAAPAPAETASPASTAPTQNASSKRQRRLFASLQLGGGYFHASSGAEPDTRHFSGGTISGLLALGGRMGQGRNVALAGAFLRDQVLGLRSKDQRIDGDEPHLGDVTFGLWAVGILVDVAMQTEPGLHLQGFAGVGALSASRTSGDIDDPTGLMASVAAGYDFKVGEHVALGGLFRVTYAPLDVRELTGTTVYITVPALLLTATAR